MTGSTEEATSPFGWDTINDLGALPEDEDIDHLLEGLKRGQIYSWVGSLLLVLNPYNEIPVSDIYSAAEFEKYRNISDIPREELSPHIFAVAAKAHYSLRQKLGSDSQVIVVSGATGTGKTFNACKCLEYLSVISKKSPFLGQGDYAHNILQRITDACRLISVFTTACTERNEVSSRHGQLVRVHYNAGAISGAAINSFLLERSRVTKGSSNFQIFYQIIFGMTDAELSSLSLSREQEYNLLQTTDSNNRRNYARNFEDTLRAFQVLNFSADEKRRVFQVLALLIHMGNIQFVEETDSCNIDLDNATSRDALKNVCRLSQLSEESVAELLTTILINPHSTRRKHTVCHRNLATIDACRNRLHSIIRHIYDLLFRWILERTNDSLSSSKQCSEWLGILDIFGFENFSFNGIEQLCVNYANEKMQQYFIKTYLESSKKELQEEGLINERQPRNTINLYKERLSVLEDSLFLTLNDACQSLVPIDMPAIVQLACRSPSNKGGKFLKHKEDKFIIEHYSCPVSYCIRDLLSNNTDKVPMEITETFNSSENRFLCFLLNMGEAQQYDTSRNCPKKTMLAKLKFSMNSLIKELHKCDLHYVRCVKPWLGECGWDKQDFRRQLACTGIFDALPLAKCKYPVRVSYVDFCKRYTKRLTTISLDQSEASARISREKCRSIVGAIISQKEAPSVVYWGKRLIFMTESFFLKLEQFRRNYRILCANRIQSFWLRHRQSKRQLAPGFILTTRSLEDLSLAEKVHDIRNEEEYDDDVFFDRETTQSSPSSPSSPSSTLKDFQETSMFGQSRCKHTTSIQEDGGSDASNDNCQSLGRKVHLKSKLVTPPRRSSISSRLRSTIEFWRERLADLKSKTVPQLEDQFVMDCLTNITRRATTANQLSALPTERDYFRSKCENHASNDYAIPKDFSPKERNKQKHVLVYDKERGLYTIQLDTYTLFYKNRILSKRLPTGNPTSAQRHARQLVSAGVTPHAEAPQGLQDCL